MTIKTLSMICMSVCFVSACSQPSADSTKTDTPNPATSPAVVSDTEVTEKQADVVTESVDTGFSYTAQGHKPDWTLEVATDNTLTFTSPENTNNIKLTATRSAYAKGSEYNGTHEGKAFYLNIRGQHCEDTTTKQTYDMKATFEFNDMTYTGCASVK